MSQWTRTDISDYSDAELSLIVFNDETLYRMRRRRKLLIETLESMYMFNIDQLNELENDLDEDEKE